MRVPATTWPVEFSLGDADAMMPARKLSNYSRVVVEARVSMNGSATPSPGDLRAVSAVIDPHRAPRLALAVNEVVGAQ
jgi:cytochrome c-type biogenesis protein CcmH